MQTPQSLDTWIKIFGLILPTLVAIFVPIITYFLITRKMAVYQAQLNKEIYEFQTKYSFLHQKKAEVIQKIYTYIVNIERNIKVLVLHLKYRQSLEKEKKDETIAEIAQKTHSACAELMRFFSENQILLNKETCKIINDIIDPLKDAGVILYWNEEIEEQDLNFMSALLEHDNKLLEMKIPQLKDRLEYEFRQILSAEPPNYQLEK